MITDTGYNQEFTRLIMALILGQIVADSADGRKRDIPVYKEKSSTYAASLDFHALECGGNSADGEELRNREELPHHPARKF